VEIPRALKDMRKASTRARVSAVILTTGADDIGFSQCLEEEFRARDDRCLGGTLDDLQVSTHRQARQTNLREIISRIIPAHVRSQMQSPLENKGHR
jgi:hypothetical protein